VTGWDGGSPILDASSEPQASYRLRGERSTARWPTPSAHQGRLVRRARRPL